MADSYHPRHRDPAELWAETQANVAYKSRLIDLHSDTCRCKMPVHGPRYLKQSNCRHCGKTIRG